MTRLAAAIGADLLAQPGHCLVGMVERQFLNAGDFKGLLPCTGMTVRTGDHQAVQHRQVDGAFNVEAEAAPGQMLAQHRLAAGLSPQMAEHQIGADTVAAQFRQFADLRRQHDGTAGMPCGGGDQAVKQVGGLDLVASPKRLDDALDMAAALAGVLDEVEVLVAANLLDANEHGWCPDRGSDTIWNPDTSRYFRAFTANQV
jgi:hypothetical protein